MCQSRKSCAVRPAERWRLVVSRTRRGMSQVSMKIAVIDREKRWSFNDRKQTVMKGL